jgi:hypothetical protein
MTSTWDEWNGNVRAGTGVLLFSSARRPPLEPLWRMCIKGSFPKLKILGVNLTAHLHLLSSESLYSILLVTGRDLNAFYEYAGAKGCCDFKSHTSIPATPPPSPPRPNGGWNLFHRQGLICDTEERTKNNK